MSKVTDLLNKYASPATPKPKSGEEKGRVTVGRVFCQPTKDGTNYKTCYWGFLDATGKFISGFTMNNAKALELVNQGVLSKDCLETFKVYAEQNFAQGRQVL